MANTIKVTKKDMFNEILALANEVNRPDIAAFATKEIALLDKRAEKVSKVSQAKVEERQALSEQILKVLAEASEPMKTGEIAAIVGISSQKAMPILKVLAESESVKVDVVKGKTKVYTLAADNEEEG